MNLAVFLAAAALAANAASAATCTLDFGGMGHGGVIPDTVGDNAEADLGYRGIASLDRDQN